MKTRLVIALCACSVLSSAYSAQIINAHTDNANIQSTQAQKTPASPLASMDSFANLNTAIYSQLSESQQADYAEQWRMSTTQFKKYLYVKANTPVGNLYGNVKQDPNILLSLNAINKGDKEEAYSYMEKAVKNEHATTAELEESQNMFQKMVQRLYPNETPIELAGQRPSSYVSFGNPFANLMRQMKSIVSDATYVLFVNAKMPNLGMSGEINGFISKLLKENKVRLDIYDTSNASSQQIVGWARAMQIKPALINGGFVTLNVTGQFVPDLQKRMGRNFASDSLFKEIDGNYEQLKWMEI